MNTQFNDNNDKEHNENITHTIKDYVCSYNYACYESAHFWTSCDRAVRMEETDVFAAM